MTRRTKGRWPCPEPVTGYPVAPHRYTWQGQPDIDNTVGAMPIREWVKLQPYQAGDVIWLDYHGEARLAYVAGVFVSYDRYNDRRAQYRVFVANKNGKQFSKAWVFVYPGHVQRGYKLAGLAPDCEGKL